MLLIIQLFFVIPLFLIQLFIPCYLFGRIHDQVIQYIQLF